MCFDTEDPLVVLVVLQSCLAYPDVLPFMKPLEFLVQNLGMPDFIGAIEDSHLRSVWVHFEYLDDLDHEIEVKVLVVLLVLVQVA